MFFKKRILKELYEFYVLNGPNNYVLADTLRCFSPGNEKFLAALNGLLREELIKGIDSGIEVKESKKYRLATAINPDKIETIQKIIRNWYEDPKFWITTLLTIVGLIIAIWQIFLK